MGSICILCRTSLPTNRRKYKISPRLPFITLPLEPSPKGIGGVLCDDRGVVLCMFSKGVEIRDSNMAEVLEALEFSLGRSMGLC